MAVADRSEEHYPLVIDIESVFILLQKKRSHLFTIALEIHSRQDLLPGSDSQSKLIFFWYFFMNLLIYSFVYLYNSSPNELILYLIAYLLSCLLTYSHTCLLDIIFHFSLSPII